VVELDLVHKMKNAYWKLVAEKQHLRLAQKNVQLAEDFLQKAKRRYDVGEATNLEYIKARVEKARTENNLVQAQNAVKIALVDLNTLLVRDSDAPVSLVDSLTFQPFNLQLQDLKNKAFAVHPKLKTLELETQLAGTRRALAWGSFLPSMELKYMKMTIAGNPDFWGAEIGLSIPLWFPLRQKGAIQQATALLRKTEFEYQALKNNIDLQVETAFAHAKSAETQVQIFQAELLVEAEEVYRIAQRSYDEGESSYLELLDAQRTLITVRTDYIHYLFSFKKALAELEVAVGESLFK
jgi:cobalt-zinc-cadmium efflux system outer membrane protein